MPENPIERYLTDMGKVRSTRSGVAETSFYPALERLLSDIGKTLSPRVRCVISLANRGAGLPDGGLFSADQFRRKARDADAKANPFLVQNPSRGVIEAKPPADDVRQVAGSEQVERYWKRYGMVLVTNFRAFALIGKGPAGQPCVLESFELADSESEFWRLTAHPRLAAAVQGERMLEYLKRVLLHNAPLAAPQDVAGILASYAHDAHLRIDRADIPALASLRQALEDALGLRFEGEKGEHFFRSTLIQTLFYGVFSAWVLWARRHDTKLSEKTGFVDALRETAMPYAVAGVFDWRSAHYLLRVPMLRALFVQVADPARLGALGLIEVLDWTAAALNRVDHAEFFLSFDEGHAVQYFYEPFLHAFDPALRKELGVWYTPEEIVRYQVERVDAVLRSELGLMDGLADPNVVVLDPCCGTGAYLTNALTGWEPPKEKPKQIAFPGFDDERDAAGRVKQEKPILVILGNPPYNAFAGVSPEEEDGLVEPYKKGLISEWGIKKFNLDDLYIRFFRLAERRIAECGGRGVVSFISNHSWVSDPSFVVLRRHLLSSFDRFWIENMHGNRKISEYAPDGRTSETVFATSGFSVGIQQGVAISLWVKHRQMASAPSSGATARIPSIVRFRNDLDDAKAVERRAHLLASLDVQDFDAQYETSNPRKDNRWTFRPSDVTSEYLGWPKLVDLCGNDALQGMDEDHANALVEINATDLSEKIQKYFDESIGWESFKSMETGLSRESASFNPEKTRLRALESESFDAARIRKYVYRPYDVRWCYYSGVPNVWKRHRPALWHQIQRGNNFLLSRAAQVASPEGVPFLFTKNLLARDCMRGHACAIPLSLITGQQAQSEPVLPGMEEDPEKITANLSPSARTYLASLGLPDPDTDQATAELIWYHALAIGYSPAYLVENADGIRQDWPRIPLPQAKDLLLASSALGRQVAALLDTEAPVPGVTAGKIRDELKHIAVFQRVDGRPANPEAGDLDLTAGWGHAGKGGVTMPGKGKLIPGDDGAFDVFLNDIACWRNVPETVWDYTIGGYQVIKKWLSYREMPLLGRGLTPDEVRYVTEMARRLATLIALQSSLDDNYLNVIRTTYPWTN